MLVQIGKDMIESFGYEVTGSSNSLNAFELFKNNPARFDLVITDQTMPNLTGAELAEQMLAIQPDLPVILCTGYSGKIDKEKAREIGVRKFVAKPLSKNKIIRIIRQVLDENSTIEN